LTFTPDLLAKKATKLLSNPPENATATSFKPRHPPLDRFFKKALKMFAASIHRYLLRFCISYVLMGLNLKPSLLTNAKFPGGNDWGFSIPSFQRAFLFVANAPMSLFSP